MRLMTDAKEAEVYREYLAIKAQPSVTTLCAKWRISRQLLAKVIRRQKGLSSGRKR
jgi:hypothetical protein